MSSVRKLITRTSVLLFRYSRISRCPLWVSSGPSLSYQPDVRYRGHSGRQKRFKHEILTAAFGQERTLKDLYSMTTVLRKAKIALSTPHEAPPLVCCSTLRPTLADSPAEAASWRSSLVQPCRTSYSVFYRNDHQSLALATFSSVV